MKITISGTPGAGKSAVAKLLAKKLNFDYFNMGHILREYARRNNLSITEVSLLAEKNKELDLKLDEIQKEFNKKDSFVMDSRLGFYFIPDSIKVFLTCSDEVAAKRIFNDNRQSEKYNTFNEALENVKIRKESERRRYLNLYGVDYTDPIHYDLLIDTSDKSIDEVVNIIIDYLRKNNLVKN